MKIESNLRSLERIDHIESLELGWDYPHTPAISPEAISRARSILPQLAVPPKVFPTGRASLQFEYGDPRSDYFEVEFMEDGTAEVLWVERSFGGAELENVSDRLVLAMSDEFASKFSEGDKLSG